MAAFYIMENFNIDASAELKHLPPGGVYIAGEMINGLTAAEAAELVMIAPEGYLVPADEAGKSIAEWAARQRNPIPVSLSGSLGLSGGTEA